MRALRLGPAARLLTYKVAHDGGSAPNPYFKVCTLATCKPRIRKHARSGDIVVGFGCRDDEHRLVYVMQVEEVMSWREYIEWCRRHMPGKIPDRRSPERFAGDCIYIIDKGGISPQPLPSASGHGREAFLKDVEQGKNVLVSRIYWYFGGGDMYRLVLPASLSMLSPRFQGHRSNANKPYIARVVGPAGGRAWNAEGRRLRDWWH